MEIDILNFLRGNSNAFLDGIFLFITELGGDIVFTLFIAAMLWCVDKKSGQLIAFAGFLSFSVNGVIKDICRVPRPITKGVDYNKEAASGVQTGDNEWSYSFPSGHSQNTAATFGALCLHYKKKRLYILSAVIVFLVGFSRVFLGVHYPSDVLAGWAIGGLVSVLAYKLYFRFYGKRFTMFLIAALIMVPAIFFGSADTVKAAGGLLGFALGSIFEDKFVKYEIKGRGFVRLALRLFFGAALLYGMRIGLKYVLPVGMAFDYIRYVLLMFTGAGLYPYAFRKLGF